MGSVTNICIPITYHAQETTKPMERLASMILIIGAVLWVISILFMDGRWQTQMLAAAILIVGIFFAHIWEEVFWEKK